MGLLTPTRRVYHRWRNVLPIYDGRACPDCGAVICGREDRRKHRELHMQTEQWQEWVTDCIMRLATGLGIPTIDPRPGGPGDQGGELAGGDGYGRVDLSVPDYDEDEEDDE